MNRISLGVALAVAAVLLPYLPSLRDLTVGGPTKPDRPVIEVPASVSDGLKAGFASSKEDAGTWSGLLYGMARSIESDVSHPQGARLRTMLDIESLRDWVVACPPQRVGGGSVIGQSIGPELAKLGTSDEPLDADRRSAVVKLLDGSAQILEDLSR